MRHVFIINPRRQAGPDRPHLCHGRTPCGPATVLRASVCSPAAPAAARSLARRAAESGEEVRLYACGGDGTIFEVANGIAGLDHAAMTCIPAGTGNDFLKNFGDQMPLVLRRGEPLGRGRAYPGPHRLQRQALHHHRLATASTPRWPRASTVTAPFPF